MIELISYQDREKWNETVTAYKKHDVYYKCEYAASFMENEDGTPYLLNFVGKTGRMCYPIIEKDIAFFGSFQEILPKGSYFDWNTPYGYGGPLSDSECFTDEDKAEFKKELFELAEKRNVVSQFLRFHPLLQNQVVLGDAIENVYIKDTVFINMDTQEDLMVQMDPKNRNLIRKAIKSGIEIRHDSGKMMEEFIEIYNATMNRDNARSFYYFPKSYYEFMKEKMEEETEYFYAFKDGKMVAASIFFYGNGVMHYHLSGNYLEYRTFAPTNLILYEAANWGRSIGMKALHLGGGLGVEDSLFHFKKQFNKNGRIGFYIGRNIFDKEKYAELLSKRKEADSEFDLNNTYYIQYRKP